MFKKAICEDNTAFTLIPEEYLTDKIILTFLILIHVIVVDEIGSYYLFDIKPEFRIYENRDVY